MSKFIKPSIFNTVQSSKLSVNSFDLSHDVKFSFKMGSLVPTLCLECVPGDKFKMSCSSLMRMAPMLAPMMHRVNVFQHTYFVPNRILWSGWESFIIGATTGNTPPAFPTVDMTGITAIGTLADYLGLPPNSKNGSIVNALPFAAYQKIWEDYYRDQNLQDSLSWPNQDDNGQSQGLLNGDNTSFTDLFTLRSRAWEHDYFTASLPFAQKGAPVPLPLGAFQDVPVYFNKSNPADPSDTAVWNGGAAFNPSGDTGDDTVLKIPLGETDPAVAPANNQGLFAETGSLTGAAATIDEVRTAWSLQVWLEKAARVGTRYFELIKGFFNVKSPDQRLQRPEYIYGTTSPIAISEVLNMTGTTDAPQGSMAGHGVSILGGNQAEYFCQEHGFIISIISVLPKTAYQDGLSRMWSKTIDNTDYFFPQFANLGEQEVLNKEVYCDPSDGLDDDTFGYNPKYSEYKFLPSRVAGDFRTTLDFWHMGRIFGTRPALNSDFVVSDPTTRIFAVEDGSDTLWCQVVHSIDAIRQMPYFGTPSSII